MGIETKGLSLETLVSHVDDEAPAWRVAADDAR
jgi:putative MFS transporter